jgi:hypothetical protein
MTNPPPDLPNAGAWEVFVPYGGLHLAAVCACALLIAGLVVTARGLAAPQEVALRRAFGIFAIIYGMTYNIWWNRHGLDPATGLPLQICDLNGLVAPLALLTGKRWLRATLYFWTFALTVQAFIQPSLTLGPASPVFWWFWAAHSIVLASAVYDLAVTWFPPAMARPRICLWRECALYCGDCPGGPPARRQLRLHRQSAARGGDPALRRCARALAPARRHSRRPGGVGVRSASLPWQRRPQTTTMV